MENILAVIYYYYYCTYSKLLYYRVIRQLNPVEFLSTSQHLLMPKISIFTATKKVHNKPIFF